MKKFLIEVTHGSDEHACDHAIQVFHETGSHFLTNALWGCLDGVHKAWIIVEVETKEDARFIVPPVFRTDATIVQLTTFTSSNIDEASKYHRA
jgi:hypothetical protein